MPADNSTLYEESLRSWHSSRELSDVYAPATKERGDCLIKTSLYHTRAPTDQQADCDTTQWRL